MDVNNGNPRSSLIPQVGNNKTGLVEICIDKSDTCSFMESLSF